MLSDQRLGQAIVTTGCSSSCRHGRIIGDPPGNSATTLDDQSRRADCQLRPGVAEVALRWPL
jgi:hypothetical protein